MVVEYAGTRAPRARAPAAVRAAFNSPSSAAARAAVHAGLQCTPGRLRVRAPRGTLRQPAIRLERGAGPAAAWPVTVMVRVYQRWPLAACPTSTARGPSSPTRDARGLPFRADGPGAPPREYDRHPRFGGAKVDASTTLVPQGALSRGREAAVSSAGRGDRGGLRSAPHRRGGGGRRRSGRCRRVGPRTGTRSPIVRPCWGSRRTNRTVIPSGGLPRRSAS